jgi:hypothetical protein
MMAYRRNLIASGGASFFRAIHGNTLTCTRTRAYELSLNFIVDEVRTKGSIQIALIGSKRVISNNVIIYPSASTFIVAQAAFLLPRNVTLPIILWCKVQPTPYAIGPYTAHHHVNLLLLRFDSLSKINSQGDAPPCQF